MRNSRPVPCPTGAFVAIVAVAVFVLNAADAAADVPAGMGASAASCEALKGVSLPEVTITGANPVTAGEAETIPALAMQAKAMSMSAFMPKLAPVLARTPTFCRAYGFIKPTSDSDIRFEVWMPSSGWNGKFQGVATGGMSGYIDYLDLAISLNRGYATASTDTGHDTGMMASDWAIHHPEKIKDFYSRGMHLTTVAAKAIIGAFYGTGPRRSYLSGCSIGGRTALMESQRFPDDYDGILAGAPARPVTEIAHGVWMAQIGSDPAVAFSFKKLQALHDAAVKQCDTVDGIADGIISDPFHCHFDPSVLQCKGADKDDCLTKPQLSAVKKFYGGFSGSDGKSLHNNMLPGTELSWAAFYLTPTPAQAPGTMTSINWYRGLIYNDPSWTLAKFDLDRDLKALTEISRPQGAETNDPDLSRFRAHGGKLIIFQGLADSGVPAEGTIAYYHSVQEKMSPAGAASVAALFLVPGMDHCGGGDAPNVFNRGDGVDPSSPPDTDASAALENWVEKGVAPRRIIASQHDPSAIHAPPANAVLVRTRPLCPYPKAAKWTGKGSSDDAANFVCK
jgi:feruloyl esterase